MRYPLYGILCAGVLSLAACSSDSGNDVAEDIASEINESRTEEGVFLDSPVEGLGYTSGDQSGHTTVDGTFVYEVGVEVSFTIGDIELGSTEGAALITPIDLVPAADSINNPTLINILRFLQTLDDDGNPDNGIRIVEGTSDLAVGRVIDFEQSIDAFTDDGNVQTVVSELTSVTGAGARELVSAGSALAHFTETLAGLGEDEDGESNGDLYDPIVADPSTLTLSGDDTAEVGSTITLTEYAFAPAEQVGLDTLFATSDNLLDVILGGSGNFNDQGVIMNTGPWGVSMRIQTDADTAWLYSVTCYNETTGEVVCDGIDYDGDNRRMTFNDLTVEPTIGGDSDSQATAPLTINGTLDWTPAGG